MEPKELPVYFGTESEPECHMLYGVSSMVNLWAALATRDTRMLKHQMDVIHSLPKNCYFVNYLRCHDDIGWGLDYEWLRNLSINESDHKRFLNDYFRGFYPGSDARGELYNDDPVLQDARLCGTTASLCGLEAAGSEQNPEKVDAAIQKIRMLNAYLFFQSGIPVIYSGDEIGQVNDYSYKEDEDADRAADSRYLHRGKFRWDLERCRNVPETVQNRIFEGMRQMEKVRFCCRPFSGQAEVWTETTHNPHVLCICRQIDQEMVVGLFNFSEDEQTAWIDMGEFAYEDLLAGGACRLQGVVLPGNGYGWFYRKWK